MSFAANKTTLFCFVYLLVWVSKNNIVCRKQLDWHRFERDPKDQSNPKWHCLNHSQPWDVLWIDPFPFNWVTLHNCLTRWSLILCLFNQNKNKDANMSLKTRGNIKQAHGNKRSAFLVNVTKVLLMTAQSPKIRGQINCGFFFPYILFCIRTHKWLYWFTTSCEL